MEAISNTGSAGWTSSRSASTTTAELFEQYRSTGDRAIRNHLVDLHRRLALSAAKRFSHRGEPLEDLQQVALLGLLKAVERYRPELGIAFTAYAQPTVLGELRRHFRDTGWAVHVPRRPKELYLRAEQERELLTHRLGRAPRMGELAEELKVSLDCLIDALYAGNGYRVDDLLGRIAHEGHGDGRVERMMAAHQVDRVNALNDRIMVVGALRRLTRREVEIVVLRYFEDLSQSEIAQRVGLSQVHVSRLLRRALTTLRSGLEGNRFPEPDPSAP